MTRNEAYLTVVEGWLRDNRGIVFTEGAVDDLCDRIALVLADNARLRQRIAELEDPHYLKGREAEVARHMREKVALAGLVTKERDSNERLTAALQNIIAGNGGECGCAETARCALEPKP